MKSVARLVSNACWYAGRLTAKAVNHIPDDWERIGEALARLSQRLMRWSLHINDRFNLDIWKS